MSKLFPRCQAIPVSGYEVKFVVDGWHRLSWHYGTDYPRPYLDPLIGPSGVSLTRMGHPGAPDHDHHQSIWFSHMNVTGLDFWLNGKGPFVRQREWLAYIDSDDEAIMAVRLDWFDGHNPAPLLEQELIVSVRPHDAAENEDPNQLPVGETLVEVETKLTPVSEQLELGKTNFGLMAVRVAKSISAVFGDGRLSSSEGLENEKTSLVKRPAGWITPGRSCLLLMPLSPIWKKGLRFSITLPIPIIQRIGMFAMMAGWVPHSALLARGWLLRLSHSSSGICCTLTGEIISLRKPQKCLKRSHALAAL